MAIIVALITVVGVIATGWFSLRAARESRGGNAYMREHIGESNGQGTVVQMVERVLVNQGKHEQIDSVRFNAIFDAVGIEDPVKQ